ncbi:POK8 protein, partial [Nothocercus julius]|nr:POK8 protein [Nothocercus julius]
VRHVTGIPHSPTGQAIVERAHSSLKAMLNKQKRGSNGDTPQDRLNKVLYVLNFLNREDEKGEMPIMRHLGRGRVLESQPPVMYRDMGIQKWEAPVSLI